MGFSSLDQAHQTLQHFREGKGESVLITILHPCTTPPTERENEKGEM